MSSLHLFGVVLLGGVLAVSSWSKLHSREVRRRFVSSVRGWRVAPDRYAGRVAAAVTGLELVTTVLLLTSVFLPVAGFRLAVSVLAALLLLGLTAGLVLLLRRGVVTGCACFGASTAPVGARHVVRNLALLAVAVLTTVTAPATTAPAVAPAVLAAGLALVGALLVIRFDDVVALFTPVPTASGS
ncbi:MauE/DoxX family redox-associated membrane protein [Jatrophihabitans sp. YIM 134969]